MYYNDLNSDRLIIWYQSTSYDWTFKYLLSENYLREPTYNTDSYPTNSFWTVESLKFDWWSYALFKEWVKFKVWYQLAKKYDYSWIIDNWINIYARVDDWFEYANFYTYNYSNGSYTTKPAIWDIYTTNSQTYEVYDITDRTNILPDTTTEEIKNLWLILHCKCTNKNFSFKKSWVKTWTLTKTSWVWDSSIRFYDCDDWFELVWKIRAIDETDLNEKQKVIILLKNFYQIQFKFDLFTNNWTLTPILYDFYLKYNIIENDIWQ